MLTGQKVFPSRNISTGVLGEEEESQKTCAHLGLSGSTRISFDRSSADSYTAFQNQTAETVPRNFLAPGIDQNRKKSNLT